MMAYTELWSATKKLSLAAFHARNLLELMIWTRYCAKSPENASRFSEDTMRDVDGLRLTMRRFADSIADFEGGVVELNRQIPQLVEYLESVEEWNALDSTYLPVSEAARALGTEMHLLYLLYRTLNAVFSKFLHPTSLMVKTMLFGEAREPLANACLVTGTKLMMDIVMEIGKYTANLKSR